MSALEVILWIAGTIYMCGVDFKIIREYVEKHKRS